MVQQLTIKLSIEPDLHLASIDTDYGIYSFQGRDPITIATFVYHYIDTDLELPNNDTMSFTNENEELVNRLLADAKNMLQNTFDENEYKKTLAIIEGAGHRGFIGGNKSYDSCLGELVNIANDILRNRDFDEMELSTISRQPKALYVYVALVAPGLVNFRLMNCLP